MKYANVRNGIVVAISTQQFADYTVPVADGIELGMSPTATDAELAAAHVEVARKAKIAGIEAKTAALLATGAEYPAASGHFHALDPDRIPVYAETQKNKNALANLPVIAKSKQVIRLANASAIDAFYATMFARYQAIAIVGAELIEDANAATTTAQLEAIVDDRT